MKKSIFLVLTAALMVACQSNSYKIKGTAEGLADGDTLYFTTDMIEGVPSDTLIVEGGKFKMTGDCDSIQMAMIYSARHNELNANFFVEPGNIVVTISGTPGESRVGGTPCNDRWQVLNDSVTAIGKRINQIAEHIYGNQVTKEEQEQGMAQIEQMNQHFQKLLLKTAEKNVDNEFGYFLLTYYPKEYIDNKDRLRLIQQMPDELRQRPLIKQLEATIATAAMTAEGSKMPAFSQPSPEGSTINIMDEVSKNKVTIIDFWASWCGPCRQEMPFMVELYKQLHDKGLGIVGVSLDNNEVDWTTAIKQLQLPWPQMSDLEGWDNAAAKQFDITSIPHTIVVDQKGTILRRGLRGEQLREFVESQL